MNEKTLLEAIYELAPTNDPRAALAIGEDERSAMDARPATAEDAETCRLLSISAAEIGDFAAGDAWRERARILAEQIPWPELVAALDMSTAFKMLAERNDDYPHGRTLDRIEGSLEAVELMRTLDGVADGPDSGIRVTPKNPTPALIRRFVLEKTGSFQLALKQWEAAAESFELAIAAAESERGRLKTRAGLALARYSAAIEAADRSAIEIALAETLAIADAADGIDERDVASTARDNAEVMTRGGGDLLLYEIL